MATLYDSQHDFECPHCGTRVAAGRRSCRECGASDDDGWQARSGEFDEYAADGAEQDEFDYEDFVAREFPDHAAAGHSAHSSRSMWVAWVIVALIAGLLWSQL